AARRSPRVCPCAAGRAVPGRIPGDSRGSSGGPRCSGPCGDLTCISPRYALSSRPLLRRAGLWVLRLWSKFEETRPPVLRTIRPMPTGPPQKPDEVNRGSRNATRAKAGPRAGRLLGQKPSAVNVDARHAHTWQVAEYSRIA